ncbi:MULTISPECIES: SusD/RagB family nutrient-binding outer membrane lipoprotein [Flavobacterium]|uniref:SusD/RagB family nutrient-binding outer membrane lipoprotein n=1 Tax=Flavobacterium panici TaxID=2654843 RepID=A0A9N8P3M6_9FLAO|nr:MULTISPECIES: SusD/RagB family nutrient-binding outer membrane lipoprotein [Flavobacterium]UUF14940.1 SusD/RagB family nutrient-binding outer membrane lipoprotein [Flavobacterium panici]CAC9976471.1 SusD/RagB family nutrient-binding outer membrane lipoprotein [Flavobacterium panici]
MKNRLIILISFITLFASCSDDFGGMNEDTKNPTITSPEFLFTNAEKTMVDQVTSTSVNFNVFRLYAQQWTEVQYPQETQYDLTGRTIPDRHWATYYRDVLRDFKEAKSLLISQKANYTGAPEGLVVFDNKIAIIDILSSYSYAILVDTFGDVPYSEALDIDGHPQPKYDDAQTIYKDLIAVLTAASHKLDQSADSYDEADLIFGGNTAKWAKFANSLRFRLAINMDDVDHTYASAQALAAQADGLILASTDGAYMPYTTNTTNNNPLYLDLVASGRDDFLPANTFVNKMNALSDPRRAKYFTEFPAGSGQYKGGVYGTVNVYGDFSHLTETIKDPVYPGVLFTYSEVEFLLAEAVERGIAVGGTAASHYNAGITASMQDWGVSSADISAYLVRSDVAYATAAGTWQQKIGEQAWISYFNRGFEAWTSYRRLDFPALVAPPVTFGDITEVPKRYSYPGIEQTLNAANLEAAVAKLGNNNVTTKIFWDKH